MKKCIFLLALTLVFIGCNKDDQAPQPTPEPTEIEKLPPPTQTGKNTVGCLVNGKAFLPSGNLTGSINPYCGYFHDTFSLVFRKVRNNNNQTGNGTEAIAIYSTNVILEENKTYILRLDNTNHSALFDITNNSNFDTYETTNEVRGELHITKLDKTNNIISGTFWFNAVNEQGKKVEIREGRFDMVFDGWAGKRIINKIKFL